jgi:hypothetical protein
MKKTLILIIFLVVTGNTLLATPLIWRGATTIKPKQFIVQSNFYYSETDKRYDWTANQWVSQTDAQKVSSINADIMFGYSFLKNLEIALQVPLASKSRDTLSSFGIGDVWLKVRYALAAKKDAPLLVTAVGAVTLPTSSEDANPAIDDQTVDIGLGLITQTKSFGKILGHLRFGYWLMGEKNDIKAGDIFEYIAKLDYKINAKMTPFLTLLGTMQSKTKVSGVAAANTEKNRHNVQIGLAYKASQILCLRPKLTIPIAALCKGGSLAPYTIGLDFWVIK